MKKSRIEHVKKYSMLSLVEDLGFTLVYESSNYYHLEEHDSLKIRVSINRFYWYSKGFGGDTITLCQTLGLEKNSEFHLYAFVEKGRKNHFHYHAALFNESKIFP